MMYTKLDDFNEGSDRKYGWMNGIEGYVIMGSIYIGVLVVGFLPISCFSRLHYLTAMSMVFLVIMGFRKMAMRERTRQRR